MKDEMTFLTKRNLKKLKICCDRREA